MTVRVEKYKNQTDEDEQDVLTLQTSNKDVIDGSHDGAGFLQSVHRPCLEQGVQPR